MILKLSLHHHRLGYSKLVRQKQLRKALRLVSGLGSEYKRLIKFFRYEQLPHGA